LAWPVPDKSLTWVAGKKEMNNLKILFRGDPFFINTYHTLCQPQGTTSGQPYAAKFIDFFVSEEGQSLIRSYGTKEHGEGLYNDAAYAKQYDHKKLLHRLCRAFSEPF
jgi:tungstate transport system substrate-binding protein